ncbi:MAG: carboxypeptidase-like regulatory domain-containing protein, partial [Candidatus Micrarchaeota archaeon]
MAEEGEEKSFYAALEDKWYAFVDWVVQKLHIPLDKIFVNPLEDHGIPSLPVAVLIVVALIGGLGFLAFGGAAAPGAPVTFSISVNAEGEPVDGAKATLKYADETLEAETVNGIASFDNVPANTQATLIIEKEGFAKVTKRIKLSDKPLTIRLQPRVETAADQARRQLLQEGYSEEQLKSLSDDEILGLARNLGLAVGGPAVNVAVQVQDAVGDPVSEASVLYEAGETSDAAVTGPDGRVSFSVPGGSSVTVVVSKEGLETKTSRFTAEEGYVHSIVLRPAMLELTTGSSAVPTPSDGTTRYSSVVVRIRGRDPVTNASVAVENASVTLYNDDNTVVGEKNGSSTADAVFASVAAGTTVYATVEADGFATTTTSRKTVEAGKTATLVALVEKARPHHLADGTVDPEGNVDSLEVIVSTQAGRPLDATVFLLDSTSKVLGQKQSG